MSLVADCVNQDLLKKVYCEAFYRAMNLYADTNEESVHSIVSALIDDCQLDTVEVLSNVVNALRSGKRKIFGRVTPNDIQELLIDAREAEAIKREQQHQTQKSDKLMIESEPFDRETFYENGRKYSEALKKIQDERKEGFNKRRYEEHKLAYLASRSNQEG